MIDHDIKTQNLKAHIIGKVVRMNWRNTVAESWIARDNCFYENVVNLLL
jgi:hypothetical protein